MDQNETPISQARISLRQGSTKRLETSSSPSGEFRLNVPAAGQFLVTVDRAGYFALKDHKVDIAGGLHFHGGAEYQTRYTLDGFDITDPVTGRYNTLLAVEGVRSLDLETARQPAQYGRGSALRHAAVINTLPREAASNISPPYHVCALPGDTAGPQRKLFRGCTAEWKPRAGVPAPFPPRAALPGTPPIRDRR